MASPFSRFVASLAVAGGMLLIPSSSQAQYCQSSGPYRFHYPAGLGVNYPDQWCPQYSDVSCLANVFGGPNGDQPGNMVASCMAGYGYIVTLMDSAGATNYDSLTYTGDLHIPPALMHAVTPSGLTMEFHGGGLCDMKGALLVALTPQTGCGHPSSGIVGIPITADRCGNGILGDDAYDPPSGGWPGGPVEACDDGNDEAGDGCDGNCAVESGSTCVSGMCRAMLGAQCSAACAKIGGTEEGYCAMGSLCLAHCGNGVLDPGEQCDDGNLDQNDACVSDCTVRPPWSCTPGPCQSVGGAVCSAACAKTGGPASGVCVRRSVCVNRCGDGVVQPPEQCDDGFTNPGDGCNESCGLELEAVSGSILYGFLTTDVGSKGPTASDPIDTSVYAPNGSTVTIIENYDVALPPTYAALGVNVTIIAPSQTQANPLRFVFTYDVSIAPLTLNVNTILITRNGVAVPNCANPALNVANPTPCVQSRKRLASNDVQIVVLTKDASDWGAGVATCAAGTGCDDPDSYACFKAKPTLDQPPFALTSVTVADRYADARVLDVKKPTGHCHPVGIAPDSGPRYATVHQLRYKVVPHAGGPKFLKRDTTVIDRLGPHAITLVRPDQILDLTAVAPGTGGVSPLADTQGVDRYVCYKARAAKDAPPLRPGGASPVANDYPASPNPDVSWTKVSHLCTPMEMNGGDPGMAGHPRELICFKGISSPITAGVLSTNGSFGARVFDEKVSQKGYGPVEFCWPTLPADLLDRNLLANGDAESGAGSPTGDTVAPTAWVSDRELTVVQYGAPAFPDGATSGPSARGANFFAGGIDTGTAGNVTTATQVVDVSSLADLFAQGTNDPAHAVRYELSGWFGGWMTQDDAAALDLQFLDAADAVVGTATVGHVSAADRGGVTALLARSATGTVPATTRRIRVALVMSRAATFGYNDGYADELSLVLTRPLDP